VTVASEGNGEIDVMGARALRRRVHVGAEILNGRSFAPVPFPPSAERADIFEPRLKPASASSACGWSPVSTSLSTGPTIENLP